MVYRRNVSRRRGSKKARSSPYRRRMSSRRVSSRSRSYRVTRGRISREELKTIDYYFGYDGSAIAPGTKDTLGNIDWCTNGEALFGIAQGAGPHERIGNVVKSRYINMNMSFVSAATASPVNDAEADPRRANSQWVTNVPDVATIVNGAVHMTGVQVLKPRSVHDLPVAQYPTALSAFNYWNAQFPGEEINLTDIYQYDFSPGMPYWGYRRTDGVEVLNGSATQSTEGVVQSHNEVTNVTNTANYNKFVRTIHRVVMFTDRRQIDGQDSVPASSLFEPYKAGFAPTPCVISQLNSNNFGRYTLLYDQTFTTDGDDPTKSISLRGFKTPLVQRYYGPTGTANSTGTIYFMYACRVPGLYGSSQSNDYTPGQISVSGRHAYTE